MIDLKEVEQVQASADRLYSQIEVEGAISRLADEINRDLSGTDPVVLCVLNGGMIVTGKLVPQLPFFLELDSVHATRYRGKTEGSELHWLHEPAIELAGRTVLLVDDILDAGVTLAAIRDYCLERGAREVKIAVLLDKRLAEPKPCRADYVGLTCEDRYIFGYGMDYKGYLRNAPGIFAVGEAQ
ncbi:hypoxanthine-guanine phosphoribosyltransferase [Methylohalobius crimeensis]|uniref:hypoxanthine-guanine phosphoribosyltransferase n=1 Tax=Methylohalobius crimeensis TaxID=244365 RepID=UPI0003B3BCB3|nr:hypoxanthine-guanine phosphoribosyltransferase [Methylohalobius crimeensis]